MKRKSIRWGILCLSTLVLAMPLVAAAVILIPPGWTPVITPDFMEIYGDATKGAALTLDGVPVGRTSSSVLGAFAPGVTNAVGNYLFGSVPPALNDGEFLLTIYGDDTVTSAKDGAAPGDSITFKLYYAPTGRTYSGYTVFDNSAAAPRVTYASFLTDPILQPHLVTLQFRNQAPVITVDGGVTRVTYLYTDNSVKGVVYRLSDPDTGDFVVVDNVVIKPAIDNASWIGVFVDGVQWDNVIRASDNSATWFQLGAGGGAFADNVAIAVKGPASTKDLKTFTVTVMAHDDVGSPTPVTPVHVQDNTVSIAVVTSSAAQEDNESWWHKTFGCAMAPVGVPRDEVSGAAAILVMLLPAALILLRRRK